MNVIIVTAGGLAREVYAWFHEQVNFVGFYDTPRCKDETIFGLPVSPEKNEDVSYVIGVGDPKRKRDLAQELDVEYCELIHPSASVELARTSKGCVICPHASIGPLAELGSHVFLNVNSVIAHGVKIGDFSFIGPNASIVESGSVGEGVFVASGATVIKHAHVGDWSIVGAGSVVTKDVPPHTVVIGVPAKPLRPNP